MAGQTVIGALRVMLGMDSAEFDKGATSAERRMSRMQGNFEKLGKRMTRVGKTLSLALTAPLAAFGVSSFKAASDAAELQSAFNQTFGDMSKTMNAWAVATGDAMGRSTQEIQTAANTFGIFFNQAAPTKKAAAEMSKTFAVLAQDLSSFYNVDPTTAMEKLRSGLSGESEPLRDFGVFLNEAAVGQKALEMGLAKTTKGLTDQQKIMARAALIMEMTKNAQGDVARTSEGTANQMRKTKAAFEELQVTIGTKLLPALTPLIEKIGRMLDWFSKLSPSVQDTVLVVGALAVALGPVLVALGGILSIGAPLLAFLGTLGGLIMSAGTLFGGLQVALAAAGGALSTFSAALLPLLANPVTIALVALAAAAFGIYEAWKHWDEIAPILQRMWEGVKKFLGGALTRILEGVLNPIGAVKRAFYDLYDAVVGHSYVPDLVDGIAAQMARLDAIMVKPVTAATSKAAQAFRDMSGEVQQLLDRLFPDVRALMTFRHERSLLQNSNLTEAQKTAAIGRLGREFGGGGGLGSGPDLSGVGPMGSEGMARAAQDYQRVLDGIRDKVGETTVRVAKSFKDMVNETMSAVQGLAGAIKGGGFLNIVQGVVGLGLQLGSTGLFGKTIAGNINKSLPGYADGGSFRIGGLGGIDRNVMAINGSPVARVGRNEVVNINPANDRGSAVRVVIEDTTGLFQTRVEQVSANTVAAAAPGIVAAGGRAGVAQMRRLQDRSLG